MKHFSEIPVPLNIQRNCAVYKGMYVPYIVLREGDIFHFKINDSFKVYECVVNHACSICGKGLGEDTWFIGGPASVFHKHGRIADLPVHKECGHYALQVCPYLAYARYTAKTDIDKLYAKLKNKDVILENTTVDFDRVPMFCFAKSNSFKIFDPHMYKPDRPYEEVEFWNDGVQLSKEEGEKILTEHFKFKYKLEDLDYPIS